VGEAYRAGMSIPHNTPQVKQTEQPVCLRVDTRFDENPVLKPTEMLPATLNVFKCALDERNKKY
jgi:hypothetical protein